MPSYGVMPPARAVKQRRSRIPLSCDPCRTRKLRCNREKPCQNCTARNEEAACKFCRPESGGDVISAAAGGREANGGAMRQRLDHLEDLVKKLIAERPRAGSAAGTHASDESPRPEVVPLSAVASDVPGAGRTVMDGVRSVYFGGDDWHLVLEEINELKRTWSREQEDDQSDYDFDPTLSHTVDGSSLLFSQVKPIERVEILSTLPPKPEVDRLISLFFHRQTFPITVPPILHEPTFMREYNDHWRDISRTNFIWLGLLFSILGITMLAYHQHGEPPEYEGISESLFQLYRMRTAQCLLSGDIAKCLPYTVETLRFNATAELNRKDDNRRGLWIMTGVVVRAAINMGYHRDPAQSQGISLLRAEYRRRVWLAVASMDDMASFHGGFPRMTSAVYSDTAEPRNLLDWELSEDMTALPPSRPLVELTPVTYLIVKARLCRALGRVADFNSVPTPSPYEAVLDIDRALHEAYESFPPQMKDGLPAGKGGLPLVGTRTSLFHLHLPSMYHQGMCTLHRRFLARGRADGRFRFSRDRCISSALMLLAFQQSLEPYYYQHAQIRHMITLAAMILFLELELRRKAPDMGASSRVEDSPHSEVLLQSLERSCARWEEAVDSCDEARRVHRFLHGMLADFRTGSEARSSSRTVSSETLFDIPNKPSSFDESLASADFDWATWDAFIEEGTSYEAGPLY